MKVQRDQVVLNKRDLSLGTGRKPRRANHLLLREMGEPGLKGLFRLENVWATFNFAGLIESTRGNHDPHFLGQR